jgi:hypothetical protein
MFTFLQRQRLRLNWGERADAMECNAEVRIYDPSSAWECYIYALSPYDDEIATVEAYGKPIVVSHGIDTIQRLTSLYNENGERMKIDKEFKPRAVKEILKKLKLGNRYDWERDQRIENENAAESGSLRPRDWGELSVSESLGAGEI